MPDWTKSMQQSFEYYTVDPGTWKDIKRINCIISSSITRDLETDTLGSATIEVTEPLGECYIRIYLITIQNDIREKIPLGTFIVQTPSYSFNGKIESYSLEAYTPLLELKEKSPPLGYSILKDTNTLDIAYQITRENVRAPVVKTVSTEKLYYDFVSDINDTWLTFNKDLLASAKYEYSIDELGRIMFSPKQDAKSLQARWTYRDDIRSILYPEIKADRDLYGIPNVVEVIYSRGYDNYYAKAVNNDRNNPLSTINRGREIVHRITDPNIPGKPTKNQIKEYANQVLRDLSSLENTVSYTHGYCNTRIGDCVRIDYMKSNLNNIKAKIISQTIKCVPGCPVTEKAVYTTQIWG